MDKWLSLLQGSQQKALLWAASQHGWWPKWATFGRVMPSNDQTRALHQTSASHSDIRAQDQIHLWRPLAVSELRKFRIRWCHTSNRISLPTRCTERIWCRGGDETVRWCQIVELWLEGGVWRSNARRTTRDWRKTVNRCKGSWPLRLSTIFD